MEFLATVQRVTDGDTIVVRTTDFVRWTRIATLEPWRLSSIRGDTVTGNLIPLEVGNRVGNKKDRLGISS
jgi:endonuclease YncB( thermonuclease family)